MSTWRKQNVRTEGKGSVVYAGYTGTSSCSFHGWIFFFTTVQNMKRKVQSFKQKISERWDSFLLLILTSCSLSLSSFSKAASSSSSNSWTQKYQSYWIER